MVNCRIGLQGRQPPFKQGMTNERGSGGVRRSPVGVDLDRHRELRAALRADRRAEQTGQPRRHVLLLVGARRSAFVVSVRVVVVGYLAGRRSVLQLRARCFARGEAPPAEVLKLGFPELVLRTMRDLSAEDRDLLRAAALLEAFDEDTLHAVLPGKRRTPNWRSATSRGSRWRCGTRATTMRCRWGCGAGGAWRRPCSCCAPPTSIGCRRGLWATRRTASAFSGIGRCWRRCRNCPALLGWPS